MARLQSAAGEANLFRSSFEDALERRNRLLIEALGQGLSQGKAARIIGCTTTNIRKVKLQGERPPE